ncbi:MAG: ABC transporter substrate-binding protein [Oscillospiraceae bacterium]
MKAKRFLAAAMAATMAALMFAGCGGSGTTTGSDSGTSTTSGSSGDEIIVGILGPFTGDLAQYGLAVDNGAKLYFDQVNENGGINGKTITYIEYDNQGDDTQAVTGYNYLVEQGMTALIGDVITSNTLAVVAEAYPDNMPMITASATADSVTYDAETDTVYSNVFRSCFTDPFQGTKMADFAAQELGATTAAVIYETGNDYAEGLADAFIEECANVGIEIVEEVGYASGDVDYNSQLTNIMAADPDVVFDPNYYTDVAMRLQQARASGLDCYSLGGDGWSSVSEYVSDPTYLQNCYYCSGYAPGSTDAVKEFEAAYQEKYGEDVPNMFAPLAYDAAMILCNALEIAESSGYETGSDEYKQAVIDAIRDDSGDLEGITSASGYTFDEHNNPVKDANIITYDENGQDIFYEVF